MVDQASAVFTALWVSITMAPKSAVNPPASTSTAMAMGEACTTSAMRMSTKPPALIMPACSRADTGVGASITSVSQPWSGKAAVLSSTAITSSSTAAWAVKDVSLAAAVDIAVKSTVPKLTQKRMAAKTSRPSAAPQMSENFVAARRASGRPG